MKAKEVIVELLKDRAWECVLLLKNMRNCKGIDDCSEEKEQDKFPHKVPVITSIQGKKPVAVLVSSHTDAIKVIKEKVSGYSEEKQKDTVVLVDWESHKRDLADCLPKSGIAIPQSCNIVTRAVSSFRFVVDIYQPRCSDVQELTPICEPYPANAADQNLLQLKEFCKVHRMYIHPETSFTDKTALSNKLSTILAGVQLNNRPEAHSRVGQDPADQWEQVYKLRAEYWAWNTKRLQLRASEVNASDIDWPAVDQMIDSWVEDISDGEDNIMKRIMESMMKSKDVVVKYEMMMLKRKIVYNRYLMLNWKFKLDAIKAEIDRWQPHEREFRRLTMVKEYWEGSYAKYVRIMKDVEALKCLSVPVFKKHGLLFAVKCIEEIIS